MSVSGLTWAAECILAFNLKSLELFFFQKHVRWVHEMCFSGRRGALAAAPGRPGMNVPWWRGPAPSLYITCCHPHCLFPEDSCPLEELDVTA